MLHDLGAANAADRWNAMLFKPTLRLNPTESDIAAGARVSFNAHVPGLTGNIQYEWSTTTAFGTLSDSLGNVGTKLTTASGQVDLQTTPSDQADIQVTVKGYLLGADNSRTFVGEGVATITINEKKTIVFGRYVTEQLFYESTGHSRHLTIAYVVVPQVKDAKEYVANCYGFNDTAYYGKHYGRSWTAPVTYLPLKLSGTTNGTYHPVSRTDSELWSGISSYSGPAEGAGEAVSNMNGRFARMVVEVMVTVA